MAIGNALKFAGKLVGRAFDKHPYGAPAVTGLGMATAYEAAKDRFGFGTEADARHEVTDRSSQLKKMIDSSYQHAKEQKGLEFSYVPEVTERDNKIIIKLKDKPMEHADFIQNWGVEGSTKDILYEVDGNLFEYDYSLFSGANFKPANITSDKGISFGLPKDTGQVY